MTNPFTPYTATNLFADKTQSFAIPSGQEGNYFSAGNANGIRDLVTDVINNGTVVLSTSIGTVSGAFSSSLAATNATLLSVSSTVTAMSGTDISTVSGTAFSASVTASQAMAAALSATTTASNALILASDADAHADLLDITLTSVSSSYHTLSGNLDSSASIWNANTTGALSSAFSASLSATNANIASYHSGAFVGAYGGLVFDAGLAGSVNTDPTGSYISGAWAVLSCSGRLSSTICYGISASIGDGRLYVQQNGIYRVGANASFEYVDSSPNTAGCHLAIFVTGTEDGTWSMAFDLVKQLSQNVLTVANVFLPSGSWVDVRFRPAANITLTTHHYQFNIFNLG